MNTKRALVLGLIAGGFYVAACGSTNSNVGETGPSAGSSGKPGTSGATGTSTAGASPAGVAGDGVSGADTSGAGGGSVGSSGASSAGESNNAGAPNGGASTGGSTGHAGSAGGINCATVKCVGATTQCTVAQAPIPQGQCCPVCVCPQLCPVSLIACPQGVAPTPLSDEANLCCPSLQCPSPLCTGKPCGTGCGTGEVPSECDATGHCLLGVAPMCPGK
jgi:hypothetical protein